MALLPRITIIALLFPLFAHGQRSAPLALPADDPVMARLDDLAALHWIKHSPFSTDTSIHNVHGFTPDQVPSWSEDVMAQRVAVLDAGTPFSLVYNRVVQSYIDLYVVRKREMSSRMLGLAELYFPIFEEQLDRHGIPLEMKYLAVVESALNPAARSRAGAVGLWQFMLPTGKLYGLKADSYIDERHDIYKSTEAACRYLDYLHRIYDDWELALAAYNCGPGNVNKAIRRAGGDKDYWKIYDYLPRETRGYVPAFIAVNYLFAHYAEHNLYPIAPTYCAYEVDTVQVCFPLDLSAIAVLTGGTVQELRELNPTFKLGIVPDVQQPVSVYAQGCRGGVHRPRGGPAVQLLRGESFRASPRGTESRSCSGPIRQAAHGEARGVAGQHRQALWARHRRTEKAQWPSQRHDPPRPETHHPQRRAFERAHGASRAGHRCWRLLRGAVGRHALEHRAAPPRRERR